MPNESTRRLPTVKEKIEARKKLDQEAKRKKEESDKKAWPKTEKWLNRLKEKGLIQDQINALQKLLNREGQKNHEEMMMLTDQNLDYLMRTLNLKENVDAKTEKIFFDDLSRLGERKRIEIEITKKDKDGEDWYLGGRIKEPDEKFWINVVGPAIKKNQKLQTLDLHTSFLGGASFEAILNGIKHHQSLEELDLAENMIKDEGVSAIGEGLKTHHVLKRLCLGLNEISAEGAKKLAEGIKISRSIQEVYLPQNHIGDAGAEAIAEAIKVNTTLKKLHIYANLVKDKGALAIANAIKENPIMEILYIWPGNTISKKVSKELRECKSWDTIRGSEKYEENWKIPIFDEMPDGSKKVHVPLPTFGPTYLM